MVTFTAETLCRKLCDGDWALEQVRQRLESIKIAIGELNLSLTERSELGRALYDLISNWVATSPLREIVPYLALSVALNNVTSEKCVGLALRRVLPVLSGKTSGASGNADLPLLLEIGLLHYETTDVDFDLNDLEEVFRQAAQLKLGLVARIGAQLIIGNRNGRQRLGLEDVLDSLMSEEKLPDVSQEDLREATLAILATQTTANWSKELPQICLSAMRSGRATSPSMIFLKLCFTGDAPPLALHQLAERGQATSCDYLVKTSDFAQEDEYLWEELHARIKAKGVVANDFPFDGEEDFVEKKFAARRVAAEWRRKHTNNTVVPFGRGGRR